MLFEKSCARSAGKFICEPINPGGEVLPEQTITDRRALKLVQLFALAHATARTVASLAFGGGAR